MNVNKIRCVYILRLFFEISDANKSMMVESSNRKSSPFETNEYLVHCLHTVPLMEQ